MLTPFSTVLSSAKFMCCASFYFHNQLTSSIAVASSSSVTPVAGELVSTQTLNSGPSTHHLTCTGSSWCILAIIFSIMLVTETSFTLLSQPSVTATVLLFINAAATQSHLITSKCPTSFPHSKNTTCQVRMHGIHKTSFQFQHVTLPPDFQAENTHTTQ